MKKFAVNFGNIDLPEFDRESDQDFWKAESGSDSTWTGSGFMGGRIRPNIDRIRNTAGGERA